MMKMDFSHVKSSYLLRNVNVAVVFQINKIEIKIFYI